MSEQQLKQVFADAVIGGSVANRLHSLVRTCRELGRREPCVSTKGIWFSIADKIEESVPRLCAHDPVDDELVDIMADAPH